MKKIPNIFGWKKIVNNYETIYSRKQNDRTVILQMNNIYNFILNGWTSCKISIYNKKEIEKEYDKDIEKDTFKKLMADLDIKYFKK